MQYPRQYNAVTDFVDRNISAGFGDKTAFADSDRTVTYSELKDNTHRVANLLAAYGIEAEDRIALLAHDSVDWPAIFWGALRSGVIPAALNTLLGAEQYDYILKDTEWIYSRCS